MSAREARSGPSKHEQRAFLRDLRRLRSRRNASLADIAGRTGFPVDALADVETGQDLPSLPALEAYLRGCGEPLGPWEDRWRRLAPVAAVSRELPTREAGASPMATAGAEAVGAEAAGPPGTGTPGTPGTDTPGTPGTPDAGQLAYTMKRLGARRSGRARTRARRPAAVSARYVTGGVAAAVLLAAAATAAALLSWTSTPGQRGPAASPATPSRAPAPARDTQGGTPAPRVTGHASPPATGGAVAPAGAWHEVTGVGCPQDRDDSVILDRARAGPGWASGGGGWTGDGCDGSAVWTMNPNGNQPLPSAMTWTFSPPNGASSCTLTVFVPTRDALGVSDYSILTASQGTSQAVATVPVSQGAVAGQWVALGTYPVSGSPVEITMSPAPAAVGKPGPGAHGKDHLAGQAPGHNAAIAASAASARCS
ncbi:MAG: helix-turn-helix domain-containing protein [Trebonia sp.]